MHDQITAQALTAVYSHPQHDLNLGYRQAIWAAYANGPIWESMSDANKRLEFWDW